MENSCNPLLHGEGKVTVSIRAERNRSFCALKGTGAAVSLTRARNYSPAFQRYGNSGCMVGDPETEEFMAKRSALNLGIACGAGTHDLT
jgi:hypothetical protein